MDLSVAVGIAIGVILVVLVAAKTTNAIAELVELVKLPARLVPNARAQAGLRSGGSGKPRSRVAKRQ